MGKYTMLHNINKVLCILLDDGRTITGKLLVFDKHMNVVLGDATEERPPGKKSAKDGAEPSSRQLGLILLRGEHVVSVTVQKGAEGSGAAGSAGANFNEAPRAAKAGATKRKRDD